MDHIIYIEQKSKSFANMNSTAHEFVDSNEMEKLFEGPPLESFNLNCCYVGLIYLSAVILDTSKYLLFTLVLVFLIGVRFVTAGVLQFTEVHEILFLYDPLSVFEKLREIFFDDIKQEKVHKKKIAIIAKDNQLPIKINLSNFNFSDRERVKVIVWPGNRNLRFNYN